MHPGRTGTPVKEKYRRSGSLLGDAKRQAAESAVPQFLLILVGPMALWSPESGSRLACRMTSRRGRRRQTWPFIKLADPDAGHRVQVFIDATFAVQPGWPSIRQHDDAAVSGP
jgi:hypothetical protein